MKYTELITAADSMARLAGRFFRDDREDLALSTLALAEKIGSLAITLRSEPCGTCNDGKTLQRRCQCKDCGRRA